MCSTLPCASARRDGPPSAPRQLAGTLDGVDDQTIDARAAHVAATFERIRTRPGTRLEWAGDDVWFTDTATVDRLDGQRRPMCWQDGHAGDLVNAALVDPNVDEDGLTAVCLRAAACAVVAADLHELTEWFSLDGEQVWDPHPNHLRFGDDPHVTHRLTFCGDRPPDPVRGRARHREWVEVTAATARRVAAELADAVTLGPLGAFEVAGDLLVHVATYHDRDSGEPSEFTWSREILGEVAVPAGGNTDAAMHAVLLAEMYCSAAQSLTHEAAEWLTLDGARPFDPHPYPHVRSEQLRPVIEFHTSPLRRPAAASRAVAA